MVDTKVTKEGLEALGLKRILGHGYDGIFVKYENENDNQTRVKLSVTLLNGAVEDVSIGRFLSGADLPKSRLPFVNLSHIEQLCHMLFNE